MKISCPNTNFRGFRNLVIFEYLILMLYDKNINLNLCQQIKEEAPSRKHYSGSTTKRLFIIDNKQALILKLYYNELKILLNLKTNESLKRSEVNNWHYDIPIIWGSSETFKIISISFCGNRFEYF